MPCERYGNLIICRPTVAGLGEARDLYCSNCRSIRRHWLQTTNDAWYDPELFWRCDLCGGTRRSPAFKGLPLLWAITREAVVEGMKE